jgi:hypothetical protein
MPKLGYKQTEEHRLTNKGKHPSNETRLKISLGLKGIKRSDETRLKDSISKLGKPFSEEHKRKISLSKLGFKHSKETKLKISKTEKGRKLSEEWKQKIGLSNKGKLKGKPSGHKGKHLSEEAKQKISLKCKLSMQTHHIDCDHSNDDESNKIELSNSQHHITHGSINKLIKLLLERKIIKFNSNLLIYELEEN